MRGFTVAGEGGYSACELSDGGTGSQLTGLGRSARARGCRRPIQAALSRGYRTSVCPGDTTPVSYASTTA